MKAQIVVLVVSAFAFWSAAFPASAALIVSGNSYTVAPGSTVLAQFTVTNASEASVSDIEGMTFTVQIAAGVGTSPKIASVDLLTSTIWTGHVSAASISVPSGGNQLQYQSRDMLTDLPGDFVDANGLLATLNIDTTGAAAGSYAIKLIGTKTAGRDSAFLDGFGDNVVATFGVGNITVAVPEPCTFLLGLCGIVGIAILRLRCCR